jgi:hypothetical protein
MAFISRIRFKSVVIIGSILSTGLPTKILSEIFTTPKRKMISAALVAEIPGRLCEVQSGPADAELIRTVFFKAGL